MASPNSAESGLPIPPDMGKKLDSESLVKLGQRSPRNVEMNVTFNGFRSFTEAKNLYKAKQDGQTLTSADQERLVRVSNYDMYFTLPEGINPDSVLANEWVDTAYDLISPEDPILGIPIKPFQKGDLYSEWLIDRLRENGCDVETEENPNTGEITVTKFLDPEKKRVEEQNKSLQEERKGKGEARTLTKKEILDSLDKKNIINYETNHLEEAEKAEVMGKIMTAIGNAESTEQREVLYELYLYMAQNNAIFPEFSHGTSSDALASIMKDGLYPADMARRIQSGDEHAVYFGEGDKGGAESSSTIISAGAGVGGLGTAMAYAEMVTNDKWNPNYMSDKDLQEKLDKELDRKYNLRNDKIQSYRRALSRHASGKENDFPLLVGFSRTALVDNIVDMPDINWAMAPTMDLNGDPILRNGKPFKDTISRDRILGRDHVLDSQVMFYRDRVMAPDIATISVPRAHLNEVRENITGMGRTDVQVVSLEALQELSKLGFERMGKAFENTTFRLQHNLQSAA